jgi:hypothetical protein
MKLQRPSRKKVSTVLEVLIIPAIILAGIVFHLSQSFLVPLLIFIALLVGAALLWTWANKDANGKEWWQDDNASGWRGY